MRDRIIMTKRVGNKNGPTKFAVLPWAHYSTHLMSRIMSINSAAVLWTDQAFLNRACFNILAYSYKVANPQVHYVIEAPACISDHHFRR